MNMQKTPFVSRPRKSANPIQKIHFVSPPKKSGTTNLQKTPSPPRKSANRMNMQKTHFVSPPRKSANPIQKTHFVSPPKKSGTTNLQKTPSPPRKSANRMNMQKTPFVSSPRKSANPSQKTHFVSPPQKSAHKPPFLSPPGKSADTNLLRTPFVFPSKKLAASKSLSLYDPYKVVSIDDSILANGLNIMKKDRSNLANGLNMMKKKDRQQPLLPIIAVPLDVRKSECKNVPKINRFLDEQSDESENNYKGVDLFSELPEALQVRIISSLDMRNAVRTGVLSKSWVNVWCGVQSVVYEYYYCEDDDLAGFIKFVDHSLHRLNSHSLEEFSLVINDKAFCPNLVDDWLSLVLEKRPKILKLEFSRTNYSVPNWFYKNSNIVDMTVRLWNYDGQQVDWGSLKKLHLSCVTISDESISKILLGCPVLHTLVLSKVAIAKLDVKNETTKHLKLIDLKVHDTSECVRVTAPFVTSVEVIGSSFESHCSLIDASSVKNVVFDYTPELSEEVGNCKWRTAAAKLLKDVSCATSVILGPVFIKIMSVLTFSRDSICSLKCKNANLRSHFHAHDLPGIISFLSHSLVETLIVEVVSPDHEHFVNNVRGFHRLSMLKDGGSILRSFKGKLSNLKSVVISFERNNNCAAINGARCFAFEFVGFLLRNARGLKKLVLASKSDDDLENLKLFSERLVRLHLEGKSARTWDLKSTKSGFQFIFY